MRKPLVGKGVSKSDHCKIERRDKPRSDAAAPRLNFRYSSAETLCCITRFPSATNSSSISLLYPIEAILTLGWQVSARKIALMRTHSVPADIKRKRRSAAAMVVSGDIVRLEGKRTFRTSNVVLTLQEPSSVGLCIETIYSTHIRAIDPSP
jgi:hypothetical protein